MKKILILALFLSSSLVAHADGNPVDPENWQIDGDLYLGSASPFGGPEDKSGVAMGGTVKTRYQSNKRNVLLYGELMGEGFNNGGDSSDIKFSQFYVNLGAMVGKPRVKWKTPANINMSRDIITNEEFTLRYAFSGLYIRMVDEREGENSLHQVLETMADFVYEYISYRTGFEGQPCPPPAPGDPKPVDCRSTYGRDGRSVLGLYAAVKYEIEKRGWGGQFSVELVQDLSPSYTKVTGKVIGFKQLSGELKNLRPYIEIDGVLDRDRLDPTGTYQGAIRVFGGISGRFGF